MDAMYVWYADTQFFRRHEHAQWDELARLKCQHTAWPVCVLPGGWWGWWDPGEQTQFCDRHQPSRSLLLGNFLLPKSNGLWLGTLLGVYHSSEIFWMGPRNQAVSPLLPGEMPKHVAELEIGNWSGPQFLDSQYSSYMFISSTSWSCFPVATVQVCCFRYLHICIYIYYTNHPIFANLHTAAFFEID